MLSKSKSSPPLKLKGLTDKHYIIPEFTRFSSVDKPFATCSLIYSIKSEYMVLANEDTPNFSHHGPRFKKICPNNILNLYCPKILT